jgi:YidC/Oxa1 family membrane protein insertase
MDQMRLLVAIALSFAVFFLWSIFFAPKAPVKKDLTAEQKTQISLPAPVETAKTKPVEQAEPVAAPKISGLPNERAARTITVDTLLYKMTLSEKGAAVTSMVLKDYRETVDPDSPLKEIISGDVKGGSVLVSLTGNPTSGLDSGIYQASPSSDHLTVGDEPLTVRFTYLSPDGIQIEKAYRFVKDSYLIGLDVKLLNATNQSIKNALSVSLRNDVKADKRSYGFEGPSSLVNSKLKQVKIGKIKNNGIIEGDIRWSAIESRYFMSSLVLKDDVKGKILLSDDNGVITSQLVENQAVLAPQETRSFDCVIFMGPKSVSLLKSFHNELDRAIYFGWTDILAKPCLWFMNFIHQFVPNYGFAIIILTIVTRMIFWPLATKSYKSMGQMRKLQPLMQEIREKYKDDKQKMNQEMMGLYKTYKINPMGGCLPMLIQLPVFFALYRMLYQAIELRHAPFIWWINDLSAPDRLFHFGFKIPFMEPPYGIPVLTLLMGATMFLQQKMTPSPGDPTQAKMMMFLPLIFTFIFINFSSGLVLYWMVSNLISISQQYYTNKKLA